MQLVELAFDVFQAGKCCFDAAEFATVQPGLDSAATAGNPRGSEFHPAAEGDVRDAELAAGRRNASATVSVDEREDCFTFCNAVTLSGIPFFASCSFGNGFFQNRAFP